jgi:guanine nucleotide-binding protein G(I)/G(S)/G(O) subunit gamma-2
MASNNTASIAQARKLVEQLKMEANIDRIKVRTTEPQKLT